MDFFGEVSEPWWTDDPVFIIGGGPSLEGRDLRGLTSRGWVLGVNRAADFVPVHATFTLDAKFLTERASDLSAWTRTGEVYAAVPEDWERAPAPGVTYLRRVQGTGLSGARTAIVNGLNSGYGALNLAVLKGARLIYLLGFDMVPLPKDAPSHWHGGYPWHTGSSHKYYGRWADKFKAAAADCNARGVYVANANSKSAIDAFPFVTYEGLGL